MNSFRTGNSRGSRVEVQEREPPLTTSVARLRDDGLLMWLAAQAKDESIDDDEVRGKRQGRYPSIDAPTDLADDTLDSVFASLAM